MTKTGSKINGVRGVWFTVAVTLATVPSAGVATGNANVEDRTLVGGGLPRMILYSHKDAMTGKRDHFMGVNGQRRRSRLDVGCQGASTVINYIAVNAGGGKSLRGLQEFRAKWDGRSSSVQWVRGLVGVPWSDQGVLWRENNTEGFDELLGRIKKHTKMEVDSGAGSQLGELNLAGSGAALDRVKELCQQEASG